MVLLKQKNIGKKLSYYLLMSTLDDDKNQGGKLKQLFPEVDSKEFIKEKIVISLFAMHVALYSYYKDKPILTKEYRDLFKTCIKKLTMSGIFENEDECFKYIDLRLKQYFQAFDKNAHPGFLYWVSKKFCEFNNSITLSGIVGIMTFIGEIIPVDVELIKDLNNSEM